MLLFPNFSKFSSYGELGCSLWPRAKHVPAHSHTNLSIRELLAQHHLGWSQREICDSNSCGHVSHLTSRKPLYAMKEEEEKAIFSLLSHFAMQSCPTS